MRFWTNYSQRASSITPHCHGRAQLLSSRRNPVESASRSTAKTLHPWPAPRSSSRRSPRKLGTGRIFSLFDLSSCFYQITVHKDTIPLPAFCTPMRLLCHKEAALLQGGSSRSSTTLSKASAASLPTSTTSSSSTPTPLFTSLL